MQLLYLPAEFSTLGYPLPCRAGLQVSCSCSTCQLSSAHWAIPVAPRGCPFEIRPPLQQRQREHTDQQQQVSDTHTVYAIVSLPLISPSDHSHLPLRPLPPPLLTTPTSDHSHFPLRPLPPPLQTTPTSPSDHSHLPLRPLPPPLQITPTSPSGHSHLPFKPLPLPLPPPLQTTPTSPSGHSHLPFRPLPPPVLRYLQHTLHGRAATKSWAWDWERGYVKSMSITNTWG